jgi:hypothetical protein
VNRDTVAQAARGEALAALPKLTPHQRDELAVSLMAMGAAARTTLAPDYLDTALALLGDVAPTLADFLRRGLATADHMNRNLT